MNQPDLPPELADLERRLADRPRPGPPAELRRRVLAAVARAGSPADVGFGWFAAAAAVLALLAINLSMSVASGTDWRLAGQRGPQDVAASADRLHKVLPELSEREARRQALILEGRARLTPAAPLPAPSPADLRLFGSE
jgi:hypothetical protein